jgi:hypothetical protein
MNAENIAMALGGRKVGTNWMARCAAHDDHEPSLSIRDAAGGSPPGLPRRNSNNAPGPTSLRKSVNAWPRSGAQKGRRYPTDSPGRS